MRHTYSMPAGQTGLILKQLTDVYIQCAPWAYFCAKCFGDAHSKINIFQVGEVWEVFKLSSMHACFNFRMECTNQLFFQTALLMYGLYIPV